MHFHVSSYMSWSLILPTTIRLCFGDRTTTRSPSTMTAAKPLIVIIPGGFHRPTHYSNIITPLRSQGYSVLSVPLVVCGDTNISPDANPTDDVKALHEQLLPLLDAGNEVIIVAHSYGSMVATACIQNQTKRERGSRGLAGGIVGAIWIAAFAFPVRGKNISGCEEEMGPLPYQVLKVSFANSDMNSGRAETDQSRTDSCLSPRPQSLFSTVISPPRLPTPRSPPSASFSLSRA